MTANDNLTCPACGADNWTQEGMMPTSQPVTLDLDGTPQYDEEWEWFGDGFEHRSFDCADCGKSYLNDAAILAAHAAKEPTT